MPVWFLLLLGAGAFVYFRNKNTNAQATKALQSGAGLGAAADQAQGLAALQQAAASNAQSVGDIGNQSQAMQDLQKMAEDPNYTPS